MTHLKNCETCINEKCEYFKYKNLYCTEGSYRGSAWAITRNVGCSTYIGDLKLGHYITEWVCKNGCGETECHYTVDYNAKLMYPDKCPMCSPGLYPNWVRINTKFVENI